jgi:acetyl-CoA carboxylase carboxyl transferase subunit beta
MNWITNYVRPKIRALVRRTESPGNLWDKCPSCGKMIFHRDLEANARVCTHCGHHLRLPAKRRLELLFDEGAFTRIELPKTAQDPLRFRDRKRYSDRLKDAREATQEQDAIVVAHGRLGGMPVVIAAFEFEFQGGSMGIAVGEGFLAAARLAVLAAGGADRRPLLGRRAHAGGDPLADAAAAHGDRGRGWSRTRAALHRRPRRSDHRRRLGLVRDAGDVSIAEPGAIIGFAGARVIEETIREKLPPGFQRAEYLLEHGMVDMVVHRHQLRDQLARLLRLLTDRSRAPRWSSCRRARSTSPRSPPAERVRQHHRRPDPGAPHRAPPQGDRHEPGAGRAPARRARPSGAPPVARDPRRRHQRQGLDRRLPARHRRGRRAARPRLHQPAPRPLQRAHPRRGHADRRRRAGGAARGDRARQRGQPITFFEITTAARSSPSPARPRT